VYDQVVLSGRLCLGLLLAPADRNNNEDQKGRRNVGAKLKEKKRRLSSPKKGLS
jgi:hypothetical protein